MNRSAVASVALALAAGAACSSSTQPATGGKDASADHTSKPVDAGVDAGPLPVPASCTGGLPPPTSLECTGLYSDLASKTLATQVRAYAPAVPQWADGSTSRRWIYLPPGKKIDATTPDEWTFPVGTAAWMELSRGGKRIETRYYLKTNASSWAYGAYAWDAAEASATLSPGANITLGGDGGTYHIPSIDECQECHAGHADSLLGFEAVSLGLHAATGLTLSQLVADGLIAPAPALTHLTIGDDGTMLAAAPLAWLHVNCGTTCHNANPNAGAVAVGMVLRLDPTKLDGKPSTTFPSITTTEGVRAASPSFPGAQRIVPGYPADSLVFRRIGERNSAQMPPIGTLVVDTADVAAVGAWIAAMPREPGFDAGVDAGRDASTEGGLHDGATHDSGEHEGGAVDAHHTDSASDGGATDAAIPDGGDSGKG